VDGPGFIHNFQIWESRGAFRGQICIMTTSEMPRIRISEPGELIEAIPYLIGFHPRESLVLIGFSDDGGTAVATRQVQVGMRVDLPSEPVTSTDLAELAEALTRSAARSVVAVIVTDVPGATPRLDDRWEHLGEVLGQALSDEGIVLLDLLLADAERWWSLCCEDEQCCPADGTPRVDGCSVTAAEATVAGLVALPDREAVESILNGCSDEKRALLEPELADAEHRVTQAVLGNGLRLLRRTDTEAVFTAIRRRSTEGTAAPRPLTARKLARFGVALTDINIRDDIWLAIDDGSIEAELFLHELLTRLPSPYDAPPLFLYGWCQWRGGNGTLASMAAERALASDARYSAARLLLGAVQHGLDPRSTPSLREPISA
jgi:hypothetical protein